jgi:PKD repeat protein
MKFLQFTFLISVLLVLSNCNKKKYPDSVQENEPEFYANINLSTGPVSITAGIDGYRLYSSYHQNEDSVYEYHSELRSQNCISVCKNSLNIQINGNEKSLPGGIADIDAALHTGAYDYQSSSWDVNFQSSYNKNASSYTWQFGDGTTSGEANPTHRYKKGGVYTVTLSVLSVDGCKNTISNKIELGYPENNCTAYVQVLHRSSDTIQFSAVAGGTAPFRYYWEFGDGKTSTEFQPTHTYSHMGSYFVKLKVIDANQDTATANFNAVTASDLSSCAANFKVNTVTKQSVGPALSTVKLSYTNNAGVEFVSNTYTQPNSTRFEILSVQDFEPNERGEATKKLHVRFNATLYNGQNSVYIGGSEAVICISYKK